MSARTDNKNIKDGRGEPKMVKCPKCAVEMERTDFTWTINDSEFHRAYIKVEREWKCKECSSQFIETIEKQVDLE